MSRFEGYICNQCGKEENDPVCGWIQTDALGLEVRSIEEKSKEGHFCSVKCLLRYFEEDSHEEHNDSR